jgi:hypothetical protein
MRTTTMEDAQGSYNHEEEFRGLHVSMGNAETKSNGRNRQAGACNYEKFAKRSVDL